MKKVQDIVLRQTVPHIRTLTVRKFRRLAVQKLPRQTVPHISTLTVQKFRRLAVQKLPRQTVPHINTLTVRKCRRLAVQKLSRQNRGQMFSRHTRKFDLRGEHHFRLNFFLHGKSAAAGMRGYSVWETV